MAETNLPALTGGSFTGASPGKWTNLTKDLSEVAKYIGVSDEDTMKLSEIKSVPHSWGHVVGFQAALKGSGGPNNEGRHPGHDDAVAQWRALLAMVALRGPMDSPLRTMAIDLPSREHTSDAQRPNLHDGGGAFPRFLTVLKEEHSIDRVDLLYAHEEGSHARDVLVGMLSSSTIVVPSRDFGGNKKLKHEWAHEGLEDPRDTLTPDQCEVCRLFVEKLIESRDFDKDVNNRLKEYKAVLAEGAKDKIENWHAREKRDLIKQDSQKLYPNKLYSLLNSVWEVTREENLPVYTDLEIAELRVGEETFRIVLADPNCAGSLNKAAKLIAVVGGDRTLGNLPQNDNDWRDLYREAARDHNIIVVRPEDLLSRHLTQLDDFEVGRGVHPSGFENKLLPIKPLALLAFGTIEKLRGSLDMGGTAAEPEVSLELTLSSSGYRRNQEGEPEKADTKGQKHWITQTYHRGEGASDHPGHLVTTMPPSCLAAWPDFRYEKWLWNYLYARYACPENSSHVVATTGVSVTYLTTDLARTNVEEWRERLAEWGSPEGPEKGSGKTTDGEVEWLRIEDELLMRANWPFDAVLFMLRKDDQSVYAGVGILPDADEVVEDEGAKAQIACDFGTTNTIVYTDVAEQGSATAILEARLRRFNNLTKRGRRVDGDGDYAFMPVTEVRQPFSTVMQRRHGASGDTFGRQWAEAGWPELWRDFAFFDPDVGNLTAHLLGKGGGSLELDLKWGDSPDHRKRARRYLRHITMLSHADVIGDKKNAVPTEIDWHFSRPLSMPSADDYEDELAKAVDTDAKPIWHNESEAALAYFAGLPNVGETGTIVVLDVGGGSTDIAIGTLKPGLKAVWPSSIRLAGNSLMTEFLLYNRSFLKILELDRRVDDGGVFGDESSRRAFMHPPKDSEPSLAAKNAASAIINSPVFGPRFEAWSAGLSGTEEMKLLRIGASLMMGGLCYFLGKQIEGLTRLRQRGDGRVHEKGWGDGNGSPVLDGVDLGVVRLCFGGKGATLLRQWQRRLEKMKSYLTRGEERSVIFSEEMKHEAAKGMLTIASAEKQQKDFDFDFKVMEQKRRRDSDEYRDYRVLGIRARLGSGDECRATTFFHTVKNHGEGEVVAEDFWKFLKMVGDDCGFEVRADLEGRQSIVTAGNQALARLSSGDQTAGDPPFVAMLGTAMKEVYKGHHVKVAWW